MDEYLLHLRDLGSADLRSEFIPTLQAMLRDRGKIYTEYAETRRDPSLLPDPNNFLVVLGSAGAITGLVQLAKAYLQRHASRKLQIDHQGNVVTLEGHSFPEEKVVLELLLGTRLPAASTPAPPVAAGALPPEPTETAPAAGSTSGETGDATATP